MEPVWTRTQVEALQVPVQEILTLHLDGQPRPLAWLDTGPRPEVAELAERHREAGPLPFTSQWTVSAPASARAVCWLVIEVERPQLRFALAFPLPEAVEDLVDIVISRSLTLLFGACPDWLLAAGRRAELVEVEQLQPLLSASLTLALDADGCDRLAQYLLAWWGSRKEREAPQDQRRGAP
jgi:hypothetical protein